MDIDKPCQGDAESLRRPLRGLRFVPDLSLWVISGCTLSLGLA